MAGIAAFQFNPCPILSPSAARLKQPNPRSPSSLPLSFSNGSSARGGGCLRVSRVAAATRYGGGGGPRRFPSDARADPDYDPALDLGRVQSASVRLLDEQQTMIGIVSKDKAIQMAEDTDLTLAILSADADPPVLRLFDSMDYKKYKYEQQKRKRVQLKRSAASRMDIKELKMGYNIDSHDYAVRLKAAQKFLKDGDKVKVIVNLKGRENEFRNIAVGLIKRFQSDIGELATEESKSFSERNIFMVLMPNKAVVQKAQEQPKKKEIPATEVSANV